MPLAVQISVSRSTTVVGSAVLLSSRQPAYQLAFIVTLIVVFNMHHISPFESCVAPKYIDLYDALLAKLDITIVRDLTAETKNQLFRR